MNVKVKIFKVNDALVSKVGALLVKEKRMNAHAERDLNAALAAHDPVESNTLLQRATQNAHWANEYMNEIRAL